MPRHSARLLFVTFSALTVVANATTVTNCSRGYYVDSSHTCKPCAPGYYSDQTPSTQGTSSCQQAQAGNYACGPLTVNNVACYGAQSQPQCPSGTYQPSRGQTTCFTCPAGTTCTGTGRTSVQKCSPGTYSATPGSTDSSCTPCPAGTFNNVDGAKSCCNCCAGTFNNQVHQTHCFSCWEQTNAHKSYSPVGATNSGQCQANPIPGVTNAPACSNSQNNNAGQATCPPEQGSAPANPSAINRRRDEFKCTKPYVKCPILHGMGGYDCVDTTSDPESCGGCTAIDGDGGGQDCTAIDDVNIVKCVQSKCIIDTCRLGYRVSSDGRSCVPRGPHYKKGGVSHHRAGMGHKHGSRK